MTFRKIFTTILLASAAGMVSAQGLKFGILIDPTVTWLRSDVKDVIRDKARMGFDLGMTVDYYFSDNYALATGVSLFNTGGTLKYANGVATFRTKDGNVTLPPGATVKYKIQYIKIPAAFKFKTHMIGRIVYSANLGLDPMARVSARADFADETNIKINQETKLLNLGWHFGLGAHYSLGGEASLFGGLSFMNTFMDITKPAHDKITAYHVALQLGVEF